MFYEAFELSPKEEALFIASPYFNPKETYIPN